MRKRAPLSPKSQLDRIAHLCVKEAWAQMKSVSFGDPAAFHTDNMGATWTYQTFVNGMYAPEGSRIQPPIPEPAEAIVGLFRHYLQHEAELGNDALLWRIEPSVNTLHQENGKEALRLRWRCVCLPNSRLGRRQS